MAGLERNGDMKAFGIPSYLRFFVAGILCITASYLSEPTLGAVACLPFIIIFPAISYLLYKRPFALSLLCGLGAVIFKGMLTSDLYEIIPFAIVLMAFALFSALTVKKIGKSFSKKHLRTAIVGILSAVILFSLHAALFGTFFGNISSKELNEKFIVNEYPEEIFTVGSTFYSASAGCYLTEVVFRDKEVYRAYFSTSKDGSEKINGYRDYCEARLLEYGTTLLEGYISSNAHEGEDYALRRDRIVTDKRITARSLPEEHFGDMCYEIAFYDVFEGNAQFEAKCREYIGFIPSSFNFRQITFLGFDSVGKDFAYTLEYSPNAKEYSVQPFDGKDFSRYKRDKDTHKYWTIIK